MTGSKFFRGFRIAILILTLIFTGSALTACGVLGEGKATPEPMLKVTAGEQELKVIYYGDRYNETREEIDKRLKMAMEDKSLEDLPYLPLGENIKLDAVNFQTEEFKITDYILMETGEIRYDEKVAQQLVLPVDGSSASMNLQSNDAAFLSSDSDDYEPGKTIRGMVIRADIEDAPFAFAIIFRTDAGTIE